MARAVQRVAAFHGPVSVSADAHGPLGLTLTGRAAGEPGDALSVAFTGRAPADLPGTLADAVIEITAPGEYRIGSPAGTWQLAATAVHVHREVAPQFFRAIPPRPAPLTRRLGYRLLLAIAASRAGLAALRALRR